MGRWRPVQLLELEFRPRSSKFRFQEIAGRMKNPWIQMTGPTTRSRGSVWGPMPNVLLRGLEFGSKVLFDPVPVRRMVPSPPPVYLGPISSAWRWLQEP